MAEGALVESHVQTPAEMRTHVNRIQEVMSKIMQQDTHYGVIPYTDKPTLFKAGSEVLLTTFRIAVDPEVEDLSEDGEIRYRVRAKGIHQTTSILIGVGVGECSSTEEKYAWRDAVCDEEFEDTDFDRRRVKYAKSRQGSNGPGYYTRNQVRTNPADAANTILKMAKKRAQIDLTLTALAASDIFTQDVEDLPDGHGHMADGARQQHQEQRPQPTQNSGGNGLATDKQVKLLLAKLMNAAMDDTELCKHFEIDALKNLPFNKVNEALEWIAENDKPSE